MEGLNSAQEALNRIPLLLQEYPDCERVVVSVGTIRMFSVDGKGNRLPD